MNSIPPFTNALSQLHHSFSHSYSQSWRVFILDTGPSRPDFFGRVYGISSPYLSLVKDRKWTFHKPFERRSTHISDQNLLEGSINLPWTQYSLVENSCYGSGKDVAVRTCLATKRQPCHSPPLHSSQHQEHLTYYSHKSASFPFKTMGRKYCTSNHQLQDVDSLKSTSYWP